MKTRKTAASLGLIATSAISLAACGSTAAATPGFKNGVWVGTGSPTDQEIVYVAKEFNELTALSDPPSAAKYMTAALRADEKKWIAEDAKKGIVYVPGADKADPTGMKPAPFTIIQQPSGLPGTSLTVAAVDICSIETTYAKYRATGKKLSGWAGYVGPSVTQVVEVRTKSGWQVQSESPVTDKRCPPGHKLPT